MGPDSRWILASTLHIVLGYAIIVAEDGVEDFTGDDHVAGLKYMKQNHGTRVEKVSDI